MAALVIERILDSRFEFAIDGGDPISDNQPNLTTFGDICHFKTRGGANIIANQNVTYADVTVIDTFGGTGSFTFTNVQNMWTTLIELNFFAGVGGGGGGSGVTRFDALLDTFTYFGNDGKIPVVNEAQLKLDAQTFYNFNEFIQMEDVAIETLIAGKIVGVALVEGVPKLVLTDPIEESDQFVSAVGGFDYNDLATATTPLAYTTGDLQLTNDISGAFTFLSQPPYGVTSVWDESTNTLDFSQLSIGDEVFLRIHINVTTSAANQISGLKILFGEGTANAYTQPIDLGIAFKTAGSYDVIRELMIYIGNEDWRTTPAKILFESDASADVEVYGWHVYIIRKSVNILDITDNDFKTFSVAQLASPTVDVSTIAGTVKIGYEGTFNKITNILFGLEFSKYMVGVDTLLATKNIEIGIYNKTKKLFLSAKITSFTEPSTGYYNAVLAEVMDIASVAVNDSLQIDFSLSDIGAGTGDVVGPVSATDNAIARYDGTTGKLIQNSVVTVSDTGEVAGVMTLDLNQVRWSKGADVASATALPILTDGNYFDVTGVTTITSINTTGKVGTLIKLHFDGILILTHHVTDLILPTGANITTQAGDEVEFLEYAAGDFRCTGYLRADGTALVGDGDTSEWATYTGTRAGGDLILTIGDYDNSNPVGIKMRYDFADKSFSFGDIDFNDSGQFMEWDYNTGFELGWKDIGFKKLIMNGEFIQFWNSAGTFRTLLQENGATGNWNINLPNASGTIALTSDIGAPIPLSPYANLAALVAGQANQLTNYIYEVTDGSGFTGITSGAIWVKYLGTTLATEADYTIISAEEWGSVSSVEGTAVLSTGEVGGTKFLREDGDGTSSWQSIPGGGDALVANPLSQFAATTSAQLAGVISDETGSGALVFADTPTLVTPVLGVATATSVNKITLTQPATGATITATDGTTTTLSGGTHSGTNTGDQDLSTYQLKPAEGAFVDGDKTKLDGIEALADVTDATNVDAAGATMNADTTLAGNGYFLDEDTMTSNSDTKVPSQQSVKAYVDSVGKTEYLMFAVGDETMALTTGLAKLTFRMPYAMTLTGVRASVVTAPTGSTIIVDINETSTTILSTKLSIDATEKTSTTAATAVVISDSALADDAEITIDIDQVGSTIAGAGLKITLIGTRA